MKIAIVGASSQIAKDLIISFARSGRVDLLLYVRNRNATLVWLQQQNIERVCSVHGYEAYGNLPHDVVINFVGVGNPSRAIEIGSSIYEITARFDDMVMNDLALNPNRRYFFISSGAVYGNNFSKPVTAATNAILAINDLGPNDFYAAAKILAEVRHRSRPDLAIIDLRVFNMFSRTQDIDARFFITDIVRAIRDKSTLLTSSDYIVRDFMHPNDFHQLVECLLAAPAVNCALDCYSREPIDKPSLLQLMITRFGLRCEVTDSQTALINATKAKPYYYSLNRKASEFGYQPSWSSLECIVTETTAILTKNQLFNN